MNTFRIVITAGWLVTGVACSTPSVESVDILTQGARVQISCPGDATLKSDIATGESEAEEIGTNAQLYTTRDLALQNTECTAAMISPEKAQQHHKAALDKALAACAADFMNSFDCARPCKKSLDKNTCAVIEGWPGIGIGPQAREVTAPDGATYFQGYCVFSATSFAEGTALAKCSE